MRIFSKLTTLVLFLTFLTLSCDNYSTSSESLKDVNDFSYVGEQHNQALDYVYQDISTSKLLNRKDAKVSVKKIIKESVSGYMDKNFDSYRTKDISLGVNIGYSSSYESPKSTFSSNYSYNSVVQNADMTAKQEELIAEIKKSIYSTEKVVELEKELNKINKKASNSLSEEDARIVYIASSVGFSSVKYWKENWSKWEKLVSTSVSKDNGGNTQPKMKYDWGEVGANDVGGAVGGATASAITGCAELTLGACAGVGAVAGGAGASVANAVYQLF